MNSQTKHATAKLHNITTFINKVTAHKLSRCYSVANDLIIYITYLNSTYLADM